MGASEGDPEKNECNSSGGGLAKDEKHHSADMSLAAETRKSAAEADQNIQTTPHETVDQSQQVSAKSTSKHHPVQENSNEDIGKLRNIKSRYTRLQESHRKFAEIINSKLPWEE